MEDWEISQNPHLNFQFPYQALEPLVWDNNAAMMTASDSLLLNNSFTLYSDFSDKEQWPTQFLADGNANHHDPASAKSDNIQLHSPMVANSQHSEILCAEEEQQSQSDLVSDDGGSRNCSEGESVERKSLKRKRSAERKIGPKYAFKTRSDSDVLEDGYKWRKYGKKTIKNSPHPRNYYRCSYSNCGVKKRVERDPTDAGMLITTYHGKHNHDSPSLIYYIGKPIILQQPASKPAVLLLNAGICS